MCIDAHTAKWMYLLSGNHGLCIFNNEKDMCYTYMLGVYLDQNSFKLE